jgi:pimeloyl-ACP methyl ester carboxylesterase
MTPSMVRANGVDFAYLEAGRGPLLLCLHGFPDTAWSFVPLMKRAAAAGYRAVAPFMRGYPPSGLAPDGDYRVITLGHDVLALIEALGEHRGFRGGARLGRRRHLYRGGACAGAARTHRHRRGAAFAPLLDLANSSPAETLALHGFLPAAGDPGAADSSGRFQMVRALVHEWSPRWNLSEEDFRRLKSAFSDPVRLSAALAYYRAMPRNLTDRATWALLFTPIKLPARMICGADDGCIGPEMFEGQEKRFAADFELITMQAAGHFMHCERPDAFAHLVLEFIQ